MGKANEIYGATKDPQRLVPIVCEATDIQLAVSGDPGRTNAQVFSHNGILGYPTARAIRLPNDWRGKLAAAEVSEAAALWVLLPTGQRASGEWIDDTLRNRAEEQGLLARLTMVAEFPRQRVEIVRGPDAESQVNEIFYRRGWTDGLPIVAPTMARVDAMLRAGGERRGLVLGEAEPLKGLVTVEKVAVNAVMAGCEDNHMPIVLAAAQALLEPEFNLRGVQTTDENVTPMLILSGPVAKTLQMNSRFGALGPGWRANAAIGRAVRLIMHNLGGGWPAAVAFAGLGQPGRYTLCLAEDEEFNPWESLREELGFQAADNVLGRATG